MGFWTQIKPGQLHTLVAPIASQVNEGWRIDGVVASDNFQLIRRAYLFVRLVFAVFRLVTHLADGQTLQVVPKRQKYLW